METLIVIIAVTYIFITAAIISTCAIFQRCRILHVIRVFNPAEVSSINGWFCIWSLHVPCLITYSHSHEICPSRQGDDGRATCWKSSWAWPLWLWGASSGAAWPAARERFNCARRRFIIITVVKFYRQPWHGRSVMLWDDWSYLRCTDFWNQSACVI